MLDDLKYLHAHDKHDVLGWAGKQLALLRDGTDILSSTGSADVQNIVCIADDEDALAAEIVRTTCSPAKPMVIITSSENLPEFIGKNSLVVVLSSAPDAPTVQLRLQTAVERGALGLAIAPSGPLVSYAESVDVRHVVVPARSPRRYGLFGLIAGLLSGLHADGLTRTGPDVLSAIGDRLTAAQSAWDPLRPLKHNDAKRLAQECLGLSIVVEASRAMMPAARRWKYGCNRAAKQIAWVSPVVDEPAEVAGWSRQPIDKPYAVISLRSMDADEQQRYDVIDRALSGLRPAPHIVTAEGNTTLEVVLWCLLYADYVTGYMALLAGNDPGVYKLEQKLSPKS